MEIENITDENTDAIKENSRPNESGGFHIEGHIKIFDPENDEVFTNTRG